MERDEILRELVKLAVRLVEFALGLIWKKNVNRTDLDNLTDRVLYAHKLVNELEKKLDQA